MGLVRATPPEDTQARIAGALPTYEVWRCSMIRASTAALLFLSCATQPPGVGQTPTYQRPCASDRDCAGGDHCVSGVCSPITCTNDADCGDPGLACSGGNCIVA